MGVVIVGAGLAGGTLAGELRAKGYDGRVVLLGAEPHLPYERPPLSKGFLLGRDPVDTAFLHDPGWYREHEIDVMTACPVAGVDVARRVVRVGDEEMPYDALVLATGAVPRRLRMVEEAGVPFAYLRTIEDSRRIQEAAVPGARLVVVGAGWIGLEVAAAARERGADVTVFEMARLPLERVLGARVAEHLAGVHRDHGVDLRLGTAVEVDDLHGYDLVVIGAGVQPDVDLARAAGLAVDDGVLVDACLRASAPDVYALGDVANHDHPVLGRLRVEHWDTAIEQGKVLAATLTGESTEYARLPYFFSDQYDLGLEYVGRAGPDAEVVLEGEPADGGFRVWWVEGGRVTAGMHVDDWDASELLWARVGGPAGDIRP